MVGPRALHALCGALVAAEHRRGQGVEYDHRGIDLPESSLNRRDKRPYAFRFQQGYGHPQQVELGRASQSRLLFPGAATVKPPSAAPEAGRSPSEGQGWSRNDSDGWM